MIATTTTTQLALPLAGPAGQTLTASRSPSPAAVYLAGLAPRSRRTMAAALETVARIASGGRHGAELFPWHELGHEHTAAIRARLAEQYAASTANLHLAAMRGCLKACWRIGLTTADHYHRAADVAPVRGSTLPRGRSLDAGELRALFDSCSSDNSAAGRRDAALLAVLYGGGLRRAEAVGLDLGDYSPDTGELRVLHGKGGKQRTTYVTNGARDAVDEWIEVRGIEPGPLFLSINKGGRIRAFRRLTDQSVYGALRKRAAQAGVAAFSPHDLRRSFVGDMLDAGADISMVQRLAGHAQVSTTQRYDRRPEQQKRRAAELLHVPHTRRRPAA